MITTRVALGLGVLAGAAALLVARARSHRPRAGDEVLVPPGAIREAHLLTGLPSAIAFVAVKVQSVMGDELSGYVVSAQGVPTVYPPIGPVHVSIRAVTRVVRNGEIV